MEVPGGSNWDLTSRGKNRGKGPGDLGGGGPALGGGGGEYLCLQGMIHLGARYHITKLEA